MNADRNALLALGCDGVQSAAHTVAVRGWPRGPSGPKPKCPTPMSIAALSRACIPQSTRIQCTVPHDSIKEMCMAVAATAHRAFRQKTAHSFPTTRFK